MPPEAEPKPFLDDNAYQYWRAAGASQARFLGVLLANAPTRTALVPDGVLAAIFKHTSQGARDAFGITDPRAGDECAAAMCAGFDAEYEAIRKLTADAAAAQ